MCVMQTFIAVSFQFKTELQKRKLNINYNLWSDEREEKLIDHIYTQ